MEDSSDALEGVVATCSCSLPGVYSGLVSSSPGSGPVCATRTPPEDDAQAQAAAFLALVDGTPDEFEPAEAGPIDSEPPPSIRERIRMMFRPPPRDIEPRQTGLRVRPAEEVAWQFGELKRDWSELAKGGSAAPVAETAVGLEMTLSGLATPSGNPRVPPAHNESGEARRSFTRSRSGQQAQVGILRRSRSSGSRSSGGSSRYGSISRVEDVLVE